VSATEQQQGGRLPLVRDSVASVLERSAKWRAAIGHWRRAFACSAGIVAALQVVLGGARQWWQGVMSNDVRPVAIGASGLHEQSRAVGWWTGLLGFLGLAGWS
jgi:hypothetical protein